MDEFTQKLWDRMCPETKDVLVKLDLRSDSEKASDQLEELIKEVKQVKLEAQEREAQARMAMEERELKTYKALNENLKEQIEIFTTLHSSIESLDPVTLQVQLLSYEKMLKTSPAADKIDVCALMDIHTELEAKRSRVAELEKRIAHLAGLPPNISQAREALKNLEEEVKMLEKNAKRKLASEVASFVIK